MTRGDRLRCALGLAASILVVALVMLAAPMLAGAGVATSTVALGRSSTPAAGMSLASDGLGYCALLRGGEARCWGDDLDGELGDGGSETFSDVPVTVRGLAGATSIVADVNSRGYCALLSNGAAKCWGYNATGELGDGEHRVFSNAPVVVKGLAGATSLTSDGAGFCAVLRSGAVKCWGDDSARQLGDGGSEPFADIPVEVKGLTTATQVAANSVVEGGVAFGSYCALLKSGGVDCWGSNASGDLGSDSTAFFSSVPVAVRQLSGATGLAGDGDGYCALVKNGAARCWGDAPDGQLGNTGTAGASQVPVTVTGLIGATSLVANEINPRGYCALALHGAVECWGEDGTPARNAPNSSSPKFSYAALTVRGLRDVTILTIGVGNSCALLRSGRADCWGTNRSGEIGDGNLDTSNIPIAVKGLTEATSLATDGFGFCAVLAGSGIKCWGSNETGELGNGDSEEQSNLAVSIKGIG